VGNRKIAGGKPIWNYKALRFCPTVFPDVSSIDAYWQQLDQCLDQALFRLCLRFFACSMAIFKSAWL